MEQAVTGRLVKVSYAQRSGNVRAGDKTPIWQAGTRKPLTVPDVSIDYARSTHASTGARRLPTPRTTRLGRGPLTAAGILIALVTLVLWARGGGLDDLAAGGMQTVDALGSLFGLVAALAAMLALVLTARPAIIERRWGMDTLWRAHRWAGMLTAFGLLAHIGFDTWAWVAGQDLVDGVIGLLAERWMIAALAASVLIVVVVGSSYHRIKASLDYETWYFLHTLGYLAVLLGFGHQLTLGTTISSDPVAWAWWVGLMVATFVVVAYARVGDILIAIGRRTRIARIEQVADDTYAVTITGPGLARMRAAGGQFVTLRVLAKGQWWHAHPYSLSAGPTTASLRLTVKMLGDGSSQLAGTPAGTRVLVEGPYGTFTRQAADGRPVLAVGGGIGITPIIALLDDLTPVDRPIVVVRARQESEIAHLPELRSRLDALDGTLYLLTGSRRQYPATTFSASALAHAVPDISERAVFVCGPAALEKSVIAGARRAGVPTRHIHHESFGH